MVLPYRIWEFPAGLGQRPVRPQSVRYAGRMHPPAFAHHRFRWLALTACVLAATGNAIVISLATLFPKAGIELQQLSLDRVRSGVGRSLDQIPPKQDEFVPVPPGSYTTGAVIMLTDGQRTTGVDPLDAAKMAADRGVKVYTVGIGTVDGEIIGFEGWSMRVRLDEETLKTIAQKTAAEYFYAGTAHDLKKVYQSLSSRLTLEKKETEVSALFALAGAALTLLAGGLSLWWFGRLL